MIVDKIVQQVTELLDEHYGNDNQTAYIYTSDHGMTDWGDYKRSNN